MREQLKETIIPNFLRDTKKIKQSDIEDALIDAFLGIKDEKNAVMKSIDRYGLSIDIETLTYIFEALLDYEDVNENGIVFTPQYIASFICDGILYDTGTWESDYKLIDPGCGCGIFLIAATLFIHEKFEIPTKTIIKNNIYGIDIIPENVSRCKRILKALVAKEGDVIEDADLHIVNADSLKDDWADIFGIAKFDYIIGNPPYVNTHDMNKDTAAFLKKTFETTKNGVYNIFYAFVERGMAYLSQTGKLSYIVPNNFLTIKSATDLRNYIQKNRYLCSVLDFADNMVFKPVRTYNCIIVMDKSEKDNFKYCVMDKTDDIPASLEYICYDEMPFEHLDKAGWKLVDHETYINLAKIEGQFKPIKDYIRTGIATLRDEVYMVFLDDGVFWKEADGVKYEIEPEIVRTIYKIPELKNCKNLKDVSRHIIFPYKKGNNGYELIDEDTMQKRYPNTYAYLKAMKSELDSRDKGKPNAVAWYAYGRTQGLSKFGRKLLFPTFADTPKFLSVDDDDALFCNGYGVFENDYLDLDELLPILNSKIMKYYVSNTSYAIEGGYYCYQKKYIERFSLPWFTEDEKLLLKVGNREKVDMLLEEKYGVCI